MSAGKPGIRQQQRSLSERVGGLEQNLARVLFGINERFQNNDRRLLAIEELVEALVNLQGSQDVQAFVDEKRVERARAAAESEKKSLDEGIKDGYVTPAETCGEKSVIIGRYINAAGAVIEPGRAQLVMTGVQPQFREQLLGKGVGVVLDLPNSEKFELLEIYSVDEEKYKALQIERSNAAAADAVAAASAAAAGDEAATTAEGQ